MDDDTNLPRFAYNHFNKLSADLVNNLHNAQLTKEPSHIVFFMTRLAYK